MAPELTPSLRAEQSSPPSKPKHKRSKSSKTRNKVKITQQATHPELEAPQDIPHDTSVQAQGLTRTSTSAQPKPKTTRRPKPKEIKSRQIFPSLHQKVLSALSPTLDPPAFHPLDANRSTTDSFPTNVMGKFYCRNKACSKKAWTSNVVATVIRSYPNNSYNAAVFSQRCIACGQIGELKVDQGSYVERVVYRLNKWGGVRQDSPPFSDKRTEPHERDLCEGCKAGVCRRRGVGERIDTTFGNLRI